MSGFGWFVLQPYPWIQTYNSLGSGGFTNIRIKSGAEMQCCVVSTLFTYIFFMAKKAMCVQCEAMWDFVCLLLYWLHAYLLRIALRIVLLDIKYSCTDGLLNNFQLSREIGRTPWTADPALSAERALRLRPDHKQSQRKRGGIRARLKLNTHRSPFPSIFFPVVPSLVNKMDKLQLQITLHKSIMKCKIRIFYGNMV